MSPECVLLEVGTVCDLHAATTGGHVATRGRASDVFFPISNGIFPTAGEVFPLCDHVSLGRRDRMADRVLKRRR